VILDIFSRYVVGWTLAPRESGTLAQLLIAETYAKQSIAPGQLTVHADRGSSMKSTLVAQLLADLASPRLTRVPMFQMTIHSRNLSSEQ
jgi:putative transposase